MHLEDSNILEFFNVLMCIEFLSDLHKMLQVASTYKTNVEYQISRFCFFSSFTSKKHTYKQKTKNHISGFKGLQNT